MHSRLLLPLAAGMISLSLISSAGAASTSPRSLILRASEVPSVLKGSSPVPVSNAQAAKRDHIPLATYESHGRVVSYDVSYGRNTGTGLLGVLNAVVQYRTPAGAHWDFSSWTKSTRRGIDQHPGSTGVFSVPSSVGDEAFGFTTRERKNGTVLHYWTVMFRRGSYWSMVMAVGNSSTSYRGEAVFWAELIDHRVRAAQ